MEQQKSERNVEKSKSSTKNNAEKNVEDEKTPTKKNINCDDSVTGYVHNVSLVKKGRKNPSVQYFNAIIQEKEDYHQLVCYSPQKRKLFEEAALAMSPVKLARIGSSPSKFKRFNSDIKFRDDSLLSAESTEMEFDYRPFQPEEKTAEMVKISEISEKQSNDIVSIRGYISIDNRPSVDVNLPYLQNPIQKKEVCINDNSGSIVLALWGSKISDITKNGTYDVFNAVFKNYRGNMSLTTNKSTNLVIAETEVKPSSIMPTELVSNKVLLPPENVHHAAKIFLHWLQQVSTKQLSESNSF